jgi:hypothetical protein
MDKIYSLLRSLSTPQKKMLRDYLQYFSIRKDPSTHLLKLAELILESEEVIPALEDCSRMIYGQMNYNGIQKLKSRLQKKVENLILLDTGTEKRDSGLDELDKYVIIIRRKVALFHVLLLSGTDNSLFLKGEMEDIIRLAKKYELYSILVEQLKYKKWMYGLKEGENVFLALDEEVKHYQRCDEALNKAVDCYYLATIRGLRQTKRSKIEQQAFLKENIDVLSKEVKATKSAVVNYYVKQLEVMYYDSQDKTMEAREAALEMLQTIKDNKSVFRKQRLAIAYMYIANSDIRSGEYDKAIEFAMAAKKYYVKGSVNYHASIEYEFHARFYQADWSNCQRLSQELLRSVKREIGDFNFAKYVFYQASVLYGQQRYKEVLRLLNYKLQISKDKQGWDVSIRTLKIQTYVDMGRTDEASTQVLGLMKHVERAFPEKGLKPREKLILRTLRTLEHEGFSGNTIKTKLEKAFDLLSNHVNYQWDPLSSELFPFEVWLSARYKLSKVRK